MDNFGTVLTIYLILFRGDINDLPFTIGYYIYAFSTVVMLAFTVICSVIYQGVFPWGCSINTDMFECNMVLFTVCLIFSAVSMLYMKLKPIVECYKKNGYVMTPDILKAMMRIVLLKKLQFMLWFALIGCLIFFRIMPDVEDSIAWTVLFGTIGFFVFFFTAYLLQSIIIEEDPEIVTVTRTYLEELKTKDNLTEEDQKILKEKLMEEGIL